MLGEAPIRTQATAQKCRETPMGRTGIVEYKALLKVAKMFIFTLYSAKTQRLDQRLFVMCFDNYGTAFRGVYCEKPFFCWSDCDFPIKRKEKKRCCFKFTFFKDK